MTSAITRLTTIATLGAALVAACGGSSAHPAQPAAPVAAAPAGGPSCGQVSDHLILLLSAEAKGAAPEAIDEMRNQLTAACESTKWTVEARRCVIDAKTGPDTDRCDPLFTKEQRDAFGGPAPSSTPPVPAEAPAPTQAAPDATSSHAAAPAAAPAPPPKATKAKAPRKKAKENGAASDPCDGGE